MKSIKELYNEYYSLEHGEPFVEWLEYQGYTHVTGDVEDVTIEVPEYEDGLYLAQWYAGGATYIIKVASGSVTHSLTYCVATGYSDDAAARDLSNWRIIRKINLEQLAEEE